jgi:UrcA family protein
MNSIVKTETLGVRGCATAMLLACVLVAFNAHAGDVRSETVKFADLNLSTPSGVDALYRRIHAAARRVCEQPAGEETAARSCMLKAEGDAVSKVNIPLLTSLYQKKTGTQPVPIIASR